MIMKPTLHISAAVVCMIVFRVLPLWTQISYTGEHLTYKLTYLSISAATVTISVPEKKKTPDGALYHVVATAKTHRLFSNFYSLDNRYDIFIDSATHLPVRMEKDIRQKTLEQRMTITYRHGRGDAVYDGGKFTPPLSSPVAPDAHNFFSMIYWLRHQPLKAGDRYTLRLDVESEPWLAAMHVTGDETVSAAGKNWQAVKIGFTFIPAREEKKRKKTDILTRRLVTSKTGLFFWLAKDGNHPFLKVEFEMSPFNVVTVLTERK